MVTYSKLLLSGSTNGRAIPVGATGFPPSLIHTAVNDPNNMDEVYLYFVNNYGSAINGTIWFGGTSLSDALIVSVPPNGSGRLEVVDGRILNNSLLVGATTTIAGTNGIFIDGFVNRMTGVASLIDPRVTDWANRVVQNGGAAPSITTQQVLSTFVLGLSSAGLMQSMLMVNCIVSDSLTAALTPLVYPRAWTNSSYVIGDLTVNGLTGNASTKRADTNLNPAVMVPVQNNVGFTWYAKTVTATGFDIGSYDGANGIMGAAKHSDNKCYGYNGSIASNAISLTSPGAGFFSDNRISATDHRLYYASSATAHAQIGSTDTTSFTGVLGSSDLFFGAEQLGSSPQFASSDTLSFYAVHYGLTASQSAALFALVQAMRVGLGGGFV